jgi:hypothetical protein
MLVKTLVERRERLRRINNMQEAGASMKLLDLARVCKYHLDYLICVVGKDTNCYFLQLPRSRGTGTFLPDLLLQLYLEFLSSWHVL